MNSFTPIPSQCLSRHAGGTSRCVRAYVCASLQLSGVVFALIGPCLLSHRASVGMLAGPFVYMHACICVQCSQQKQFLHEQFHTYSFLVPVQVCWGLVLVNTGVCMCIVAVVRGYFRIDRSLPILSQSLCGYVSGPL